jgi:two-component system chemotaxis response regulator CheY
MNTQSPHVAIVDDEEDTVSLLERYFSLFNIPVSYEAYNGLEAVDLFKAATKRPDVIIMDHRMPVANGVEATRQILELDPRVRIIFLSADPGIADDALSAGASDFMKKPVSVREIVNAVRDSI